MKIVLDIEEDGQVVRSIEADADEHDNIGIIAPRFAAALGLELEELLEDLSVDGKQLDHRDRVPDCNGHGHHLRHRRVCINLHFETENHEHRFPARAKWARVHHRGCKHFHVAHDACANLELHDGAIDGPALNDNKEIGQFPGCKRIWLVKPGPEPNGTTRQARR
jgi:hypothetical protein